MKIHTCRECQNDNKHLNEKEIIAKEFLIAAALQRYEMVRYYIEMLDMHPDTTFGGKPTAICYAGLKQDLCFLEYLTEQGACVNTTDETGMSPLHYATLGGCVSCVAFLIKMGAKVNHTANNGKTALTLAKEKPRLAECSELLTRYGASQHNERQREPMFH